MGESSPSGRKFSVQIVIYHWLVVWNIHFIFPFSWEFHHPNWRSYFSEGWPNHQPDQYLSVFFQIDWIRLVGGENRNLAVYYLGKGWRPANDNGWRWDTLWQLVSHGTSPCSRVQNRTSWAIFHMWKYRRIVRGRTGKNLERYLNSAWRISNLGCCKLSDVAFSWSTISLIFVANRRQWNSDCARRFIVTYSDLRSEMIYWNRI